jgi:hypothetical protein
VCRRGALTPPIVGKIVCKQAPAFGRELDGCDVLDPKIHLAKPTADSSGDVAAGEKPRRPRADPRALELLPLNTDRDGHLGGGPSGMAA